MKTVISIKVDKNVRDRARNVARKLGVPLSLVVNSQLRRFADEQRIVIAAPLVPNSKTKKILDEAIQDIRENKHGKFSPLFENAKDAVKWLHSK